MGVPIRDLPGVAIAILLFVLVYYILGEENIGTFVTIAPPWMFYVALAVILGGVIGLSMFIWNRITRRFF